MSNLPTHQTCLTCGWEKCAGFHCSECRAPFKSLLGLRIHEGKTHGTGRLSPDLVSIDSEKDTNFTVPPDSQQNRPGQARGSVENNNPLTPKKPAESELSKGGSPSTEVDTTSIPETDDELMEILDEWGRAAMDVLNEPRISPTDLMAAKNEAHTAIEALYAARFERAMEEGRRSEIAELMTFTLEPEILAAEVEARFKGIMRNEARTRWEKGDGNE